MDDVIFQINTSGPYDFVMFTGDLVNKPKETELVKSKNGKEYLRVVKEEKIEKRQKDMPTRLNARKKIMKMAVSFCLIQSFGKNLQSCAIQKLMHGYWLFQTM